MIERSFPRGGTYAEKARYAKDAANRFEKQVAGGVDLHVRIAAASRIDELRRYSDIAFKITHGNRMTMSDRMFWLRISKGKMGRLLL